MCVIVIIIITSLYCLIRIYAHSRTHKCTRRLSFNIMHIDFADHFSVAKKTTSDLFDCFTAMQLHKSFSFTPPKQTKQSSK